MMILSNDPDGDDRKYGVFVTLFLIIPYRMILALWALVAIAAIYTVVAILMCVMGYVILKFIMSLASPLHYVW